MLEVQVVRPVLPVGWPASGAIMATTVSSSASETELVAGFSGVCRALIFASIYAASPRITSAPIKPLLDKSRSTFFSICNKLRREALVLQQFVAHLEFAEALIGSLRSLRVLGQPVLAGLSLGGGLLAIVRNLRSYLSSILQKRFGKIAQPRTIFVQNRLGRILGQPGPPSLVGKIIATAVKEGT